MTSYCYKTQKYLTGLEGAKEALRLAQEEYELVHTAKAYEYVRFMGAKPGQEAEFVRNIKEVCSETIKEALAEIAGRF